MGKHREQGHFDRARWRLALLVPFWILQVVFLLSLMGVFSYRLVATSELLKDEEKKASVSTVKIVWVSLPPLRPQQTMLFGRGRIRN